MARVIKRKGKNATQAKGKTMHGSPYERQVRAIEGRQANRDKKPNGFLSRRTKPARGRRPGRP